LSPLTKAFVVLVTILSLLLVALVVPFVANTRDLGSQVSELQSELQTARATAGNAQQQVEALRAQKDQVITELRSENKNLSNEVNQFQAQLSNLESDLASAQARNDRLAASYDAIAATSDQNAKLLDRLTQDLQQSQNKLVSQSRKIIQLSNQNTELQSSMEGLTQQVRHFKEQVQQYQDRIAQVESRWQKVPQQVRNQIGTGESGLAATPPQPISGQVTAVNRPSGNATLVQINVGSRDQVAENMEFVISRNNNFLGTMVVEQVNANEAVGRVQLKNGQIQTGDSVYAGPDA